MSLSRPPEEQPSVKPFDPLVLDRTVIAIPLLREMEADLKHIQFVESVDAEAARNFNAAIQYNAGFPNGTDGAYKLVVEMAIAAAQEAKEAETRAPIPSGPAGEAATRRRDALLEAIQAQTIAPPREIAPGISVSFARLHAAIIRR